MNRHLTLDQREIKLSSNNKTWWVGYVRFDHEEDNMDNAVSKASFLPEESIEIVNKQTLITKER